MNLSYRNTSATIKTTIKVVYAFHRVLQSIEKIYTFANMKALPEDFVRTTSALMGDRLFAILQQGLADVPSVSIRLNPFKCANRSVHIRQSAGLVPWCEYAHYLSNRPDFTFDPLLHAGLYYVQEASSMFVDHVLRCLVHRPVTMLDLCAAPGGKTTCARTALPIGSLLYSNEPIRQRAQILAENVQKMGHPDVVVTNNLPRDYQRSRLVFDLIMADVPCSGEGMFRKDEGAISEWSLQHVEQCWHLQRDIIADIWPCLKPGGYLIYSTCTFNAHENEENVAWIVRELGAEYVEIPIEPSWNITGSLTGEGVVYRFIPGLTRGEGLFMAVLRKHGELAPSPIKAVAPKPLQVLSHGIAPDIVKGKSSIPHISKALSLLSGKQAYPQVEITYAQAIDYLRHEALVLPSHTARGIVLLTYKQVPLGFAKNIGNRANNLYPAEWKIKTTHLPVEPFLPLSIE